MSIVRIDPEGWRNAQHIAIIVVVDLVPIQMDFCSKWPQQGLCRSKALEQPQAFHNRRPHAIAATGLSQPAATGHCSHRLSTTIRPQVISDTGFPCGHMPCTGVGPGPSWRDCGGPLSRHGRRPKGPAKKDEVSLPQTGLFFSLAWKTQLSNKLFLYLLIL